MMEKNSIKFASIKIAVIDEADEILQGDLLKPVQNMFMLIPNDA